MRYKQGDVVLVPFPFTNLASNKTRPTVIISTEDFFKETGNVIVAMITSVGRKTRYDHELLHWEDADLLKPSWVRAKCATLSPTIIRYKAGELSSDDLEQVSDMICSAISFTS